MSTKKINYLIGNAELLTKQVPGPKRKMDKVPLYSADEIKTRLIPQLNKLIESSNNLNNELCPKDLTVSAITLHPSFIAKTAFPSKFLRSFGGVNLGSKSTKILPDKWNKVAAPEETPTTKLFIAVKRSQLSEFKNSLEELTDEDALITDLEKIWDIEFVQPDSKIKNNPEQVQGYFEIGLHLLPSGDTEFIKREFIKFAQKLGLEIRADLAIGISNLWFVPCVGDENLVHELAKFSFVRVIRPIPTLRSFTPIFKALPISANISIAKQKPLDSSIKVAILDGGLPETHILEPWVKNYKLADNTAKDHEDGLSHGLGVTSAFLFGPLKPGLINTKPYSYVDHHRVVDSKIIYENPLELYRTLNHIEDILLSRQYEFLNLSLGPNLPIDDDEIHPWTSLIDSYLADGETFLTIAAGNNGESDLEAGLCRIQVPSDCINALSVGASTHIDSHWKKASYSAIGPGRSPGRIKPDLLAFGGSPDQYFHIPHELNSSQIVPTCGTSFSAPYLLRSAVGIRAVLGEQVSLMAIKALLIHNSIKNDESKNHIGWGKIPENLNDFIVSPDGVVKILYQGELNPGKYLNVPLPIPSDGINGMISMKATCCIACDTDPQDSAMYTKAGITIKWNPKIGKGSQPFFKQTTFATEAELRSDAGKWETVLHNQVNKRGSSMEEPAFELHYSARENGADAGSRARPIKYAFLVTIEAPKNQDIFTDILNEYSHILSEIEPQIDLPIQIQS